MKQLIAETSTWPAGPRLALFFFLPSAVVLQLFRAFAEVPLYIEYRITTALRATRAMAAPPLVGEIAEGVSAVGRAAMRATKILAVLALVVIGISLAAANLHGVEATKGSGHLLASSGRIIDRWWNMFSRRAGITG